MANVIKKVKIKQSDGTYTDYIPIGAEASNVTTEDGMSVENKLKKKPYYFNSVEEMKNAGFLKEGDTVITLGYYEINDGNSVLYRIRSKTDKDVIDNINIIAIDVNKKLVAEFIKNNVERSRCLVCVTKIDNGSSYNLMLSRSYDGINFGDMIKLNGITIPYEHRNVAVNFCYTHNKFYILTSIGYWFSKDLINWSEMYSFGEKISAPSIYGNYLYYHHQDSNEEIVNVVNTTTYPFSIRKCPIIFNSDGTITLGESLILIESSSIKSHIDPIVISFKGVTYLACKDEIKAIIKLYTINNNTLKDTEFSHRGVGIEACKLIPNGENLFIYADPYGIQTNYEDTTNVSYDRDLSIRMTAINSEGINTDALLTPINCSYEYHPAFNLIDSLEGVKLIDSLNFSPIITKTTHFHKQIKFSSSISDEIISVINHPNRPLFITGNTLNNNAYLRFTKIFEDSPLIIRFDRSSGTNIHPAHGINGHNDLSSTDIIIKETEIITAPIYNTSSNSFVFLPVEQYEYRRQLEILSATKDIQTSLNEKFLKGNSINFFIISGYGTDININNLPTASNFFGEYYKQNTNFGHIKLYRIGNTVIEYQATISNGVIGNWVQTH